MSRVLLFIIAGIALSFSCFAQSIKKGSSVDTTVSNLEGGIIDTILSLQEVRQRAAYIEAQTKGKRHLEGLIYQRPETKHPYYWVKVVEDNGSSHYTHFNFYIYPKSRTIKFLDTVNDKIIDLAVWRKRKKNFQ